MGNKVKGLFKNSKSKLAFGVQKDRAYYFQKNEEQLQREKIMQDYEYIRSFAR
jgi:hypothetical protein